MNELSIVQYLNHLGSGTIIDQISIFISWIFVIVMLWTILSLSSYFLDEKKGKFVLFGVVMAMALHFIISEGLIKNLLTFFFDPRIRPYLADPQNVVPLGQLFTDSSFPSSHLASTAAVLTVFVYYYRKTLVPAIIFVLLMAFSRIHNGMHYPTDVLFGTVLGIGYGFLAIYLSRKVIVYFSKKRLLGK